MRPQHVEKHAELRIDLLREDALQDEAEVRSHLPRHDGEVAELLLGDAAEALDAIIANVLRRGGAEQERRLPQPLHALARAIRSNREGAVEEFARTPRRRLRPAG